VTGYEPGRRIAGDDRAKPWCDWVLYGLDGGGLFAALYVGGALVHWDAVDGWCVFDWAAWKFRGLPRRRRLSDVTVSRARACCPTGWPLLPTQEGLL
jgi:hypothetical protein